MDKVIGKHLKKLSRQEDKLLEQPGGTFMKPLTDKVEDKIPEELIVFIISLFPVLELRGGLIAASLLGVDFIPAFVISYVANMLPIPFILLFIRKIFHPGSFSAFLPQLQV